MEQSLKLIVDYIHAKKGVWITAIPPRNQREVLLMNYMAQISAEYFEGLK